MWVLTPADLLRVRLPSAETGADGSKWRENPLKDVEHLRTKRLERWVWGQPAGAGGVPYTQPRPRHWGCSRKCMKRQSPPFLPCLLPDTQNAKYGQRASDERSFGHLLNPQPQLTPGRLVSQWLLLTLIRRISGDWSLSPGSSSPAGPTATCLDLQAFLSQKPPPPATEDGPLSCPL